MPGPDEMIKAPGARRSIAVAPRAAAATISVVSPHMNGIGGDGGVAGF